MGERQFGVAVADGPTQAYHTLEAAIRANPTKVILALDCSKAFPSVHRDIAHKVENIKAPLLARAMEIWYSEPGRKVYRPPHSSTP